MKRIFIFLLSFGFFLSLVSSADAHVGGGPPFLTVNDKYAQTNPYYQQELLNVTIAQDTSPEVYLVGKAINLALDIEALTKQTTIPSSMVKDLSFRWSLATGTNFENIDKNYQIGAKAMYTFEKTGSYLVMVEGKSPIDDDYILLDTVQLDVVPSLDYALPQLSVFIGIQGSASERPVLLVSRPTVDKGTRVKEYKWDFSDGKIEEGQQIEHRFNALSPYNTRMIYHRIIDGNNVSTEVGFAAENYKGEMQFVPFGGMKSAPISIGTYHQAKSLGQNKSELSGEKFVLIGVGIFVVFTLFTFSSSIVKRLRRLIKPKR